MILVITRTVFCICPHIYVYIIAIYKLLNIIFNSTSLSWLKVRNFLFSDRVYIQKISIYRDVDTYTKMKPFSKNVWESNSGKEGKGVVGTWDGGVVLVVESQRLVYNFSNYRHNIQ